MAGYNKASAAVEGLPGPEGGHQNEVVTLLKDLLGRRKGQRQWGKSKQEGIRPFVGLGILFKRGVLFYPGEPKRSLG